MPVKDTRPLKNIDNVNMLNMLRAELSLDYQHRVPEATKANIQRTIESLVSSNGTMNEFVSALVNRIGLVISKNMIWTNPLATFKRGMLTYGDTIEEIYTGLLTARTYDPDRENMEKILFGSEVPPVEANFHRVNRQEMYKFTVNEDLLKRAFLEPNGLQEFITTLMTAPVTSDNWDEFLLTCSLFAEYEKNGGFHHVNIPDIRAIDSDGADARFALRQIRSMAGTLKFPSTHYNAAKMPSFANPEDLVLFMSPEAQAAIDVEALSAAFNIDRANVEQKIVTIPQDKFGIDGVQAILTTSDFFVIADQKIETTQMPNPASLHTNYFYHHWSVISCSRFAPAVAFGTFPSDPITITQILPATVSIPVFTDIDEAIVTVGQRGYIYQATSYANSAGAEPFDTGVTWSVEGALSNRTYITATGVLHIGPDEPNNELTVVATATTINAADPDATRVKAEAVITVEGDMLPDWPTGRGAGQEGAGGTP